MRPPWSTTRRLAGLALLVTAFPLAASAETVILLEATDAPLRARAPDATQAVATVLAGEGARILTQQQAEARVGGAAASCTGPECTAELVRGSGADVAVAQSLQPADEASDRDILFLTLIDRAGRRFPGQAPMDDPDLLRVVRDALHDARSLQLLGPGPWLRVHSIPAGAQVLLDGRPMGSTPTRAAVTAGRHTLEIRLQGLRPHARTVDVPADPSRQIEIDADLAPRGRAPARRASTRIAAPLRAVDPASTRSRPVVGPLILGVAGLAVLGYETLQVGSNRCKARDGNGECTRRTKIDPHEATAIAGLGAAAMVGALLWHVLAEDADEPPPIAFSPTFVQARVQF